jgi:hypothetical protein
MSDCCLPNLGCLAIPILSTNVLGPPGPVGTNGVGIASTFYDPLTGIVTFTYTDGTTSTTGDIRGPIGGNGPQGIGGVSRLYSMPVDFFSSTTINSWVQQHDVAIPANTLLGDGDALVVNLVSMYLIQNTAVADLFKAQRRIRWGVGTSVGVSCTLSPSIQEIYMFTANTSFQYNTKLEIIKTSATTALCRVTSDMNIASLSTSDIGYQQYTYQRNLTGLDFTVLNTIYTDLYQAVVNQVYFKSITIDKISAV